MENILTKDFVLRNLNTYGAIIVIFTYSILLDRDFACTCKPGQGSACYLYLILPVVLIFVLILWTDKTFLKISRYSCPACCKCNCRFLASFLCHSLKALLTGGLWASFVLLDGDWYVCCRNTTPLHQLACKDTKNLTYDDRVNIAELKNESREYGSFLLLVIILVAAAMSMIGWRKCCEKKSRCCNRKKLYYKLILEEEGNVLKEILRESAKKQLTNEVKDKISDGRWEESFDVAEKLIEDSTEPALYEQEKQEQLLDI